MRVLLAAVFVLMTAACVAQDTWSPIALYTGPGHLQLSNFRYDRAQIEAVVGGAPDCSPAAGGSPLDFDLPFKGARVLDAPPGEVTICWRRLVGPGQWSDWNRAFITPGLSVDAEL